MGQKVNPVSFRLQVHKNWSSRWFGQNKRDFAAWLAEDIKIRELIEARYASRPTIDRIEIERSPNQITIAIHTAKAGVVIGRGGAGVTELKRQIEKIASLPVRINIEEVRRPELSAKLVSENIARQLERRANFRRAVKMAAQNTMNSGAKGIRIEVAAGLTMPRWHAARRSSRARCHCIPCGPISTSIPHGPTALALVLSVSRSGSIRVKGVRSNVATEENKISQSPHW